MYGGADKQCRATVAGDGNISVQSSGYAVQFCAGLQPDITSYGARAMSRETRSFFRRVLGDESGAAAVLVAVGIFALVGFGALSVDVGYLYSAQRELQASANAAAMAGARDIGVGGTPVATATSYSSVAGNKNANPNLTLASITPTLFCLTREARAPSIRRPLMRRTGQTV